MSVVLVVNVLLCFVAGFCAWQTQKFRVVWVAEVLEATMDVSRSRCTVEVGDRNWWLQIDVLDSRNSGFMSHAVTRMLSGGVSQCYRVTSIGKIEVCRSLERVEEVRVVCVFFVCKEPVAWLALPLLLAWARL